MGEALAAFFTRVEEVGGIKAKVRLAELTQMPSMVASVTEDTAALVARFNAATRQVIEEFAASEPWAADPQHAASRWDRCIDLLIQRDHYVHSREETAARVTEFTTSLLRITRCSVWYLADEGAALECLDVYDATRREHTRGPRLDAGRYAPYFEALHREETLAASNARTDARTACFRESYLEPLGLWSLLDTPIWCKGEMLGVLCCEHVQVRPWSNDEREYALFLGQLVALGEELRQGSYARNDSGS
jgi:hypothetical protein